MKKKILIINDYFLPAQKAGGIVKSIDNMIKLISIKYDFYICTRSHDVADKKNFIEAKEGKWFYNSDYSAFYIRNFFDYLNFLSELISERYYKIYFNSVFSFWFSFLPIIFIRLMRNRSSSNKIIVAPRGELMSGAIMLKNNKKLFFLAFAKKINLYRDVIWHASNQMEQNSIVNVFGKLQNIKIAQDVSSRIKFSFDSKKIALASKLQLTFVSRVTPKKNLYFLLQVLTHISFPLSLTIVGSLEDQKYWKRCVIIIKKLPKNIDVDVIGPVNYFEVNKFYLSADILALPTLGENFGHVFVEAMMAGTCILTSNHNIWEKKKVDAIICEELIIEAWVERLSKYFQKSVTEKINIRTNSQSFIQEFLDESNELCDNINLFK